MQEESFFHLPLRSIGVVDADVMLANVFHQARHGVTPKLVSAARWGTLRLFAADHVYFEVYEHLPRVAADADASYTNVREIFERDHLPLIRFVTVDPDLSPELRAHQVADPSDVPTGVLAELIAPAVLYSRDRHLKRHQLAAPDWLEASQATLDAGESDRTTQSIALMMAIPPTGFIGLVRWLGTTLNVSPWAIGALLLAMAAKPLSDPQRRRTLGSWVLATGRGIETVLSKAFEAQQSGIERVTAAAVPALASPSVTSSVAHVLARREKALLAGQICEAIDSDVRPSVQEVRSVLTMNPAFIRRQHSRWELGKLAGPLSG